MVPDWFIWISGSSSLLLLGSASLFFWGRNERYAALHSLMIALCLGVLTVDLMIRNDWLRKDQQSHLPVYFGELVPADESPLPATLPHNVFSLMLGDNLQVLSASSAQAILKKDDKPFVSIGMGQGNMWITTSLVDSQNRNIVRVIRNEFQAFPEGAFNPKQPDAHSLVVRDAEGVEVLNLRFLNRRRIRLVGRFYLAGLGTIVVDPQHGIRWPGGGGIEGLTMDMTNAPQAGFIGF